MRRPATPQLVLLGVVVAAAVLVAFNDPGPRGPWTRTRDIPLRVANWRGQDVAHDPRLYGVPLTADYLARSYAEPGGSTVDLLAVSGEDLGAMADPAWNLRTHGWRVEHVAGSADLPAAWLVCRREQTVMVAGYWFVSAAGEGPSLAAQELKVGSRNLLGRGVPHGVAVFRVTVAASDAEWAKGEAERFVRVLLGSAGRR